MTKSLPNLLLKLSGTFEFELLVRLVLANWGHPHANDSGYCDGVMENAVEILRSAESGMRFFDELEPGQMNLVASVWYSESISDESMLSHESDEVRNAREAWLTDVRRALPSCFCNPQDLG